MRKSKIILITTFVLTIFLFIGCSRKDYVSILSEKNLSRFYFSTTANDKLSLAIEGEINDKEINALMPHAYNLCPLG